MNLLIAEDSTKMRKAIRKIFEPYFDNIFECDNGISAVTEYESKKPDWVFMDIKMENMDGITATREITGQYPYAKVIIVTGYDDDDFRKEAGSNGAVGYVLKENLNDIFKIINIKK